MLHKYFFLSVLTTLLASCGGNQNNQQPASPAPGNATPLTKETPAESVKPASVPFSKEVSYDNIKFQVSSAGLPAENSFTITPTGLSASNDPFTEKIKGQVIDVQADDMDGDNSPEVAVIVEESPGGKRMAYVYTAFGRKSFGAVHFVDVTDASKLAGYQGGDEFAFVENTFIRRFPLYSGGQKTGKTRQFQFKLKAGEAMKQLVLDKEIEF